MAINFTKKQRIAVINNLRGKQGPKTIEGKRKSSLNGKKNKGPKNAKARAKILTGRWGIKDSLYEASDCLNCTRECLSISLTIKTPLSDIQYICLSEIIKKRIDKCFYFFHGLCGIMYDYDKLELEKRISDYCLLDDFFLSKPFPYDSNSEKYKKELLYRIRFYKLKKEMEIYLQKSRSKGFLNHKLEPRMKFVLKQLSSFLMNLKVCKLSGFRSQFDLEDYLKDFIDNCNNSI